ncbi:GNAT family N-acetyltransferase [Geomicrobium sp. JCM 19038]|uniref:GNAT family N-acetyltransferase n=1 Tax=Geomicrobium sp. JCM 19038 TaxID=1460635 RepID=UPI00045F15E2|nr:GNAT family N-acetyltransferase [Geomicrobium sp. JCM 19038]GAK09195.1 acetyltransferase, GNAT family [Geomicrobium sp. JCM 19038]
MNVEIREVRKEDIESIKTITIEAFAKGFIEDEQLLDAAVTMMFVSPILNKSSFGRVATLDGEVVGVIFGSRVGEAPTYRMLQEDYTKEMLHLLNQEDDDRDLFVQLTNSTNEAYKKLIQGKEHEFQGCLEFFAVSEQARGKKVGKKLLNELFSYFTETNTNKIYVYTDTMSNYGFMIIMALFV